MERRLIWTSVLDLSKQGIAQFCTEVAPKYGKTEEEFQKLSPLDLATSYMWNERRRKKQEVMHKLKSPCDTPILVIGDIADFGGSSHIECNILARESLSDIFSVPNGLCTTFYSDGKDIRCETITDNGTDYFLFRFVTQLKGFGEFISLVKSGTAFTESELSQYTASLLPKTAELLGWSNIPSLDAQIHQAEKKRPDPNKDTPAPVPVRE